ncbi:MAG: formylglycine-generating enzyme family protein, partial [Anaerolineales bacterium]|nr:formylglycine-generating enzyme family protein [Anaerolineales bacterium]
ISIPTEIPIQAFTPTPTSSQVTIPTLGIGSIMNSEKDGMTILYVPAGEFTMGIKDGGPDKEMPVHTVYLDAFWIDQTEVTNKQYAACVSDGGCTPPYDTSSHSRASYYGNSEFDDFPVIYVIWRQANAYCSWAGRELPTEAQWEKAARGTDERAYPWGNDAPNDTLLNYNRKVDDTTKVGSYETGKSFYGAYDMAGNVWEWVTSLYKPYPYDASDGRENMNSSNTRVVRGGSWVNDYLYVRSAIRYRGYPVSASGIDGFRCARSLP